MALVLFAGPKRAAGSPAIDSVKFYFDRQQLVLPGETFQIGLISYQHNGKIRKTTGLLKGSATWLRYKVEVQGGTFSAGNIRVSDSLVPSSGRYLYIKAYPKKHPELAVDTLLALNYETRIEFRPTSAVPRIPGSVINGELYVEFNNGVSKVFKNLKSNRDGGNYQFEGYSGTWSKGKFTIDPDIRNIANHRAGIIVSAINNRNIADTFSVQLDYRYPFRLRLSGSSGFSGSRGSDGWNSQNGGRGGDGQNGGFGQWGDDGPDIGVWADLYYDSVLKQNLLYVYAQNLRDGHEYRFLVNPDGGSLQVTSAGGDGGSGGYGGDGGNGGNGSDGRTWTETSIEKRKVLKPEKQKIKRLKTVTETGPDGKIITREIEVEEEVEVMVEVTEDVEVKTEKQGPGQDGGDGGCGGAGGLGGCGGYGGNIELYFTVDARPYSYLVTARSIGGQGGSHGRGGQGGRGGIGGRGNPDGRAGYSGYDGPYALFRADDGQSGRIQVSTTEEFFSY